jgi:hypothetical protein
VAGVDDEGGGEEGVAGVCAGTTAVERVLAGELWGGSGSGGSDGSVRLKRKTRDGGEMYGVVESRLVDIVRFYEMAIEVVGMGGDEMLSVEICTHV